MPRRIYRDDAQACDTARVKWLDRWLSCRACSLHENRRKVVIGRGTIPAPLLFVGEAPGKSEDLRGAAFVGPSGRLLRLAIADAELLAGTPAPAYYITNVVACRPCDGPHSPNRQPLPEEVVACRPRLSETVALVKPDRVIFLGRVAENDAGALCPDGEGLVHPAFILRRGGRSSADYRTFVRELAKVFKEMGD